MNKVAKDDPCEPLQNQAPDEAQSEALGMRVPCPLFTGGDTGYLVWASANP